MTPREDWKPQKRDHGWPGMVPTRFPSLLKGIGLEILWRPVLAMAALGGSLFGFGMRRFRRQFE